MAQALQSYRVNFLSSPSRQPDVMHRTHIVHLTAPLAPGDLDEQIRQWDVRAVDGDQLPFGVLPLPSALLAR
jgi:hypothetical protein